MATPSETSNSGPVTARSRARRDVPARRARTAPPPLRMGTGSGRLRPTSPSRPTSAVRGTAKIGPPSTSRPSVRSCPHRAAGSGPPEVIGGMTWTAAACFSSRRAGFDGRQQALDSRSQRLPVARSYNAYGGWMVDRRPPRGSLPGTSSSPSRGQHTAPAADPRERSWRGVDRWPKGRVVALQEAANGEPTCEPANFLLSGSPQVLLPPDDAVHPDHLRTVREPHDIRPSFAGD